MATMLVLGASGNTGSELSRLLAAAGHDVRRATSRATTGAGQVHVDLATGAGLDAALAGAEGVFLLAPPGHADQHALLAPVVDAAVRHGVQRAVLMTAMGVDVDEAIPFRRLERHLERSGLAWNVIRPNWFMQNFHTFWLPGIRAAGAIMLPTGRAKGSFIDARDIAATAFVLLSGSVFANRAFDLTGGEALDHDEVAAILTRETGRPIRYQEITPDAMRQGLLGAGLPAPYVEGMLGILEAFRQGHAARISDAVPTITGRAPITMAEYARDHRGAFAEVAVPAGA
jgi:uncharacterized protein YbjT (DUF2867 family)